MSSSSAMRTNKTNSTSNFRLHWTQNPPSPCKYIWGGKRTCRPSRLYLNSKQVLSTKWRHKNANTKHTQKIWKLTSLSFCHWGPYKITLKKLGSRQARLNDFGRTRKKNGSLNRSVIPFDQISITLIRYFLFALHIVIHFPQTLNRQKNKNDCTIRNVLWKSSRIQSAKLRFHFEK
jgi:hypothetical protein